VTHFASRILRAASLVVTDRRWAGPLSAMALGFGLFIGVAIGPNAAGTLAGIPRIIEIPSFGAGSGEGGEGGGGPGIVAGGGGGSTGGGALGGLPAPAPLPLTPSEPQPVAEGPSPEPAPERGDAPEGEEGVQLEGIVVHLNRAAGSYTLAIEGGELVAVHAPKLPAPGTRLSLLGRPLANNTFAEAEAPTTKGRTTRATFTGTVTFGDPDPADPAYTVSGRGASILVHVRPDPAGAPARVPPPGSYVTVEVVIEKPADGAPEALHATGDAPAAPTASAAGGQSCERDSSLPAPKATPPAAVLWQRRIDVEAGEPVTYLDLAGIVTAVCRDSGQMLISADGIREAEADLLLAVPSQIDATKLGIDESVLATATLEEDGGMTLSGIASDELKRGAEDAGTAQGDLKR
jgi:hypothetical protein